IFLLVICYSVGRLGVGILRGHQDSHSAALSRDILPNMFALAGFGAAIFFFEEPTEWIALVYWLVFQGSILFISILYIFHQKYPIRIPTWHSLSKLTRFALPLALSATLLQIMSNIDILFIAAYSSNEVVGYYRSVYPIAIIIMIGLTSTVFIYLPIATEYYENSEWKSLREIFQVVTKWVTVLTFPLFLVFALFSTGTIS
ncbi:MAG: oligosaccharide flippase family protein, partial [Halobacteriaceae archaeon]